MEAVTPPSPGLFALTLRVLGTADPWDSSEGLLVNQLAQNLSPLEASQLPHAIGEVLSLLRSNTERLKFATDVVVTFNFYEAATHLVEVALGHKECRDRRLIINAASICAHPSVPQDVRARIYEVASEIPAARIRLDPTAVASNEPLVRLQRRCWPGLQTDDDHLGLPPTVVFDSSVDKRGMLWLASALHLHGYALRRIGEDGNLPEWFGNRTTVVCTAKLADRLSVDIPLDDAQVIQTDDGTLDEMTLKSVLLEVWESRPSDWKPNAEEPKLSHGPSRRSDPLREWLPSIAGAQEPYVEPLVELPYLDRHANLERKIRSITQQPELVRMATELIENIARTVSEKHGHYGLPSTPEYGSLRLTTRDDYRLAQVDARITDTDIARLLGETQQI